MKKLLMAACALAPLSAWAMDDPARGPLDSRVRVERYADMQVVRLCSTGLNPMTVILEDGEHTIMIAGMLVTEKKDEAKDWFLTKAGSMIVLQPLHDMKPADDAMSMLVLGTLTADKTQRHYQFQLCTRPGDSQADPQAYNVVKFAYTPAPVPGDPNAAQLAAARREAARRAAEERVVQARFAAVGSGAGDTCTRYGGTINCEYEKRGAGCPILTPSYAPGSGRRFVWDDGISTRLLWPPHATVPSVFIVNQDGKEAVVSPTNNDTPNGLEVMLPTVYRALVLRRSGQVCAIRNNRFDAIGEQPGGGTGTISPDVMLQARGGR